MYIGKYISDKQLGCLKAVQKINNELYNNEGWDNHTTLLSMSICSYYFRVVINLNDSDTEIELHNSKQDDRIYYEKSDKYEEWYSYLKRRFRENKSKIKKIKL